MLTHSDFKSCSWRSFGFVGKRMMGAVRSVAAWLLWCLEYQDPADTVRVTCWRVDKERGAELS